YFPGVPPLLLHHHPGRVPVGQVPWLFQGTGASVDGASIRLIGILDVHVQEGGTRRAGSGVTHHDDGVTDTEEDRRHVGTVVSRRAGHLLDECDQVPCLVNHDSWRHRVPAFGCETGTRLLGRHFVGSRPLAPPSRGRSSATIVHHA